MQSSRDIFLKFEIVDLTGNWVHLSQVRDLYIPRGKPLGLYGNLEKT